MAIKKYATLTYSLDGRHWHWFDAKTMHVYSGIFYKWDIDLMVDYIVKNSDAIITQLIQRFRRRTCAEKVKRTYIQQIIILNHYLYLIWRFFHQPVCYLLFEQVKPTNTEGDKKL